MLANKLNGVSQHVITHMGYSWAWTEQYGTHVALWYIFRETSPKWNTQRHCDQIFMGPTWASSPHAVTAHKAIMWTKMFADTGHMCTWLQGLIIFYVATRTTIVVSALGYSICESHCAKTTMGLVLTFSLTTSIGYNLCDIIYLLTALHFWRSFTFW